MLTSTALCNAASVSSRSLDGLVACVCVVAEEAAEGDRWRGPLVVDDNTEGAVEDAETDCGETICHCGSWSVGLKGCEMMISSLGESISVGESSMRPDLSGPKWKLVSVG